MMLPQDSDYQHMLIDVYVGKKGDTGYASK